MATRWAAGDIEWRRSVVDMEDLGVLWVERWCMNMYRRGMRRLE